MVKKEQPAAEMIREIFTEAEEVLNGAKKMGKIAFVFSGQGAQYSGMGSRSWRNSLLPQPRCLPWPTKSVRIRRSNVFSVQKRN